MTRALHPGLTAPASVALALALAGCPARGGGPPTTPTEPTPAVSVWADGDDPLGGPLICTVEDPAGATSTPCAVAGAALTVTAPPASGPWFAGAMTRTPTGFALAGQLSGAPDQPAAIALTADFFALGAAFEAVVFLPDGRDLRLRVAPTAR